MKAISDANSGNSEVEDIQNSKRKRIAPRRLLDQRNTDDESDTAETATPIMNSTSHLTPPRFPTLVSVDEEPNNYNSNPEQNFLSPGDRLFAIFSPSTDSPEFTQTNIYSPESASAVNVLSPNTTTDGTFLYVYCM